MTIEGFEKLWARLQDLGIDTFYTRYANQDPCENFFSCIRSHTPTNTHPTSYQFEQSYKTLLINNMSSAKSAGGNCEYDMASPAAMTLKEYIENTVTGSDTEHHTENVMRASTLNLNPHIVTAAVRERDLASDIAKEVNCDDCKESSLSPELKESAIRTRVAFSCFVGQVIHYKDVKTFISSKMSASINMDWHFCSEHRNIFKAQLARTLAELMINMWCQEMNSNAKEKSAAEDLASLVAIKKKEKNQKTWI